MAPPELRTLIVPVGGGDPNYLIVIGERVADVTLFFPDLRPIFVIITLTRCQFDSLSVVSNGPVEVSLAAPEMGTIVVPGGGVGPNHLRVFGNRAIEASLAEPELSASDVGSWVYAPRLAVIF